MHIGQTAEQAPDRAAVIMAADGAVTGYAGLDDRSCRVARLLAEHGIGRGDHIAILMENRREYLEVCWGAQRSGVRYTPVNWHLAPAEAAYVVRDCGAAALFTSLPLAALADHARSASPGVRLAVLAGATPAQAAATGFADYEAELARQAAGPPERQVEGVTFFYSSGTTGRPKGIAREHAFPEFGTGRGIDVAMRGFGFDESSVYLCPAPLYHAAPLGWSMGTHRCGGTVVVMDRFDPVECLRAIERYRVTHVQFVPTHFVRMLKLAAAEREAFDLSSLKMVVHAAAPCPVEVKQQMIDWLGPVLLEYYAGSEGSGMTVITSPEWLERRGSVGRAAGGVTVHIVGEDGAELGPGEVGGIYFAGGGQFRYHNDEAKTAAAHNDQGWSTLGDLGHLDGDGYLFLADRRTDLIISGGVNIYPAEVEEALVMHPAVADVAVIGIPDAEMGQSVRAVIQPAAGAVAGDDLAASLLAFARERLAGFKVPRSVVFAAELPRLPTGKILRRQVREDHAG